MKHILLVLSVFTLAACDTTSHIVVGNKRPAISAKSVKIYAQPPKKYEQIALLNTDSVYTYAFTMQGAMDAMIERLKQDAASLGANGVILTDRGSQLTGQTAFAMPLSVKTLAATAVFVMED